MAPAGAPRPVSPVFASTSDLLERLEVEPTNGLSTEEAARRLATVGPNALPPEPPVPAWRRFLGQMANPLTILLLAATGVSVIAWLIDREEVLPFEAAVILAIMVLNAALGWIQESRAEQAIASLQAKGRRDAQADYGSARRLRVAERAFPVAVRRAAVTGAAVHLVRAVEPPIA